MPARERLIRRRTLYLIGDGAVALILIRALAVRNALPRAIVDDLVVHVRRHATMLRLRRSRRNSDGLTRVSGASGGTPPVSREFHALPLSTVSTCHCASASCVCVCVCVSRVSALVTRPSFPPATGGRPTGPGRAGHVSTPPPLLRANMLYFGTP